MSIRVSSVTKTYKDQKALHQVSFAAKKGEIIGFLGPNGAGKSTMMKILTGFIRPNEGSVFINEIDVLENALEAQKTIGYLPEQNPLYTDMYVREYLQFHASIYKVSKTEIDSCIQKVGLATEAHKKIHQLSKGYQQRVGLAAAILHNPEVLILDEPTTGLDPNQLVEIRSLIKTLGKNKTVLFSTHIMQEVEAVCDRVIIIKKGAILLDKKLEELQVKHQQIIEVAFHRAIDAHEFQELPKLSTAVHIKNNIWELTFSSDEDMGALVFDFAQEKGLKISSLQTKNKNLETLFREITS